MAEDLLHRLTRQDNTGGVTSVDTAGTTRKRLKESRHRASGTPKRLDASTSEPRGLPQKGVANPSKATYENPRLWEDEDVSAETYLRLCQETPAQPRWDHMLNSNYHELMLALRHLYLADPRAWLEYFK